MFETVYGATIRNFLTDGRELEGANRPGTLVLPIYVKPPAPDQEQLRLLIISNPVWVRETIHDLHGRGFASATEWSSLQPGANPGEVVSLLTRRRSRRYMGD